MAESMFGEGANIFDVASSENTNIRDRALDVAQLARGRVGVYANTLAGGMVTSGLARLAGLKTPEEEKTEVINDIMQESMDLDRNNPKHIQLLAKKFFDAGFPNIAQKFMERARTIMTEDRTHGLEVRKTDISADVNVIARENLAFDKEQQVDLQAYREQSLDLEGDKLDLDRDEWSTRADRLVLEKQQQEDLQVYREADLSIREDQGDLARDKWSTAADRLAWEIAQAEEAAAQGNLIEVSIPGNNNGAKAWATVTYDENNNPVIKYISKASVTSNLSPQKDSSADISTYVDGGQQPIVEEDISSQLTMSGPFTQEESAAKSKIEAEKYWSGDSSVNTDTLESLATSDYLVSDAGNYPEEPTGRTKQLIDAEDRERIAASIEASYTGDSESTDGIKAIRKLIREAVPSDELGKWEGSLTDSTVYRDLGRNLATLTSGERADLRLDRAEESAIAAAIQSRQDDDYQQVISGNDGKDIAAGFILKTGTGTLGDTEANALAGHIGADINAYDMALAGDRQLDSENIAQGVTPQQAYLGGYYEKALAYPGVYTKDTKPGVLGWGRGDTIYDSLRFKTVLNKTLARGTSKVYPGELESFVRAGLIIPNVTVIVAPSTNQNPDGIIGTLTEKDLSELIATYNKNEQ